jgi:hypothetical protein
VDGGDDDDDDDDNNNNNNNMIVPVTVAAIGIVTKDAKKNLEAIPGTHSVPKTVVLGTAQCCSVNGGGSPSVQRKYREGIPVTRESNTAIHPQVFSSTGLPTFLPLCTLQPSVLLYFLAGFVLPYSSFRACSLSSLQALVAKVSSVTTARCCELRRVTLPVCSVSSTQRQTETDAICVWFQAFFAM